MKTRHLFSLILIVFVFDFSFILGNASQIKDTEKGVIKGTVFDYTGAVIPNTIIYLKGKKVKLKIISDNNGNYFVKITKGIYTLHTNETNDFLPFNRAPFHIKEGEEKVLNITLSTSSNLISILSVGKRTNQENKKRTPPKSFSTKLFPTDKRNLYLFIRCFDVKRSSQTTTCSNATISYDNLWIYADYIEFSSKEMFIKAKGEKVIYDDGNTRRQVNFLKIVFKNKELIPYLSFEESGKYFDDMKQAPPLLLKLKF